MWGRSRGTTLLGSLVLVLLQNHNIMVSAQKTEREILLEFYRETGGSSWTKNFGWEEQADNVCDWYGVYCQGDFNGFRRRMQEEDQQGDTTDDTDDASDTDTDDTTITTDATPFNAPVVALDLHENNLSGRTPASLFQLPLLESLYLSYNAKLDVSFLGSEYAQNLKEIKMHSTATSSVSGISAMADTLESLHMSGSQLTGIEIPHEIWELSNLSFLHLAECGFVGTIPSDLEGLTRLQELNLFQNDLTGTIPAALEGMRELRVLAMSLNQLHGPLPGFLEELPALEEVYLERNEISGGLLSFATQDRLHKLYLTNNDLTGTIPLDFMAAAQGEGVHIQLSGNELTGTVPGSLDALDQINLRLDLFENQFIDIDDALCDNGLWMDGNVAQFGCNAIMCPVGTYSPAGRELPDEPCEPCESGINMGQTYCLDSDEPGILTRFFQDTSGPTSWYRKDNWGNLDVIVCEWQGVMCWDDGTERDGFVRAIELDNNGLEGTIPTSIYALQHLEILSLSYNAVVLPFDGIDTYNALHRVEISATSTKDFEGIEAANDFFRHLTADKLDISGTLPKEILSVASLNTLSMSECDLGGELPETIQQLSNLEELYMFGNNFKGQLPEALGNLPFLTVLSLAKNQFTGTLPDSLNKLGSLQALSLTDQVTKGGGLSGDILSFSQNSELSTLMLAQNRFQGPIPSDLLSSVNEQTPMLVDLSSNVLTGTVPGALSRFRRLDLLVTNNLLSDIDQALCSMNEWMGGNVREYGCDAILCPEYTTSAAGRRMYDTVKCNDCSDPNMSPFLGQVVCGMRETVLTERMILQLLFDLTGGLGWNNNKHWYTDDKHECEWYGVSCDNAKSVVSIVLGSNGLRGQIPTELFKLPNLARLSLFNNEVTFSFEGIENAKNLESLVLDSTGLTSLQGVEMARGLKELNVRYNRLSGSLSSELSSLVHLESLQISNNQFNGPLPEWLGNLPSLSSFLAADNKFTGPVLDFAQFPNLIYVDLSNNQLTGTVPATFLFNVEPAEKVFVDLSKNRIGGTLPADLMRLERLSVRLQDNRIEEVPSQLCDREGWNDYDVQSYGCNGILCPPGTYSETGRQVRDETPCVECADAKYMGSTTCSGALQRRVTALLGGAVSLALVTSWLLL